MACWKDVLIERGVDFESMDRKKLKVEAGCVIVGLESITGAPATEEEWDLRLEELRQTGASSARQEFQKLQALVANLANQPTLMGERLAAMNASAEELMPADVRRYIAEYKDVLAALPLQERDGTIVWHAAHLVEGINGKLVDATDPNLFHLSDDQVSHPFDSIIFSRK